MIINIAINQTQSLFLSSSLFLLHCTEVLNIFFHARNSFTGEQSFLMDHLETFNLRTRCKLELHIFNCVFQWPAKEGGECQNVDPFPCMRFWLLSCSWLSYLFGTIFLVHSPDEMCRSISMVFTNFWERLASISTNHSSWGGVRKDVHHEKRGQENGNTGTTFPPPPPPSPHTPHITFLIVTFNDLRRKVENVKAQTLFHVCDFGF